MGRKRYRGHFCWVCGRIRPNERFSGGGHKRHVCRDCRKLGPAELAIRQKIRNLERLLHYGLVPRKRRLAFQQALQDPEPRVREFAGNMLCATACEGAYLAAMSEVEELLHEQVGLVFWYSDQAFDLSDCAEPDEDYESLFWYPDCEEAFDAGGFTVAAEQDDELPS